MIGTKLAHYVVTSHLGSGGMGEVYQATDTKLGREVAIKTLPEEFANDADRLARFEREAKLLASLNHPNIGAIYGLEESNDIRFLVLELVEGQTLSDRLQRGAMPVEESLKVALQIAEALEAAHEKGIIHRDLKPSNVKITPDGKVKVLDFGLAKAWEGAHESVALSDSPTLSLAATRAGVILGTAAYMAPEQAKGLAADPRSDIFAFGCVLYEMLTGRQAFQGETVADVLAGVLAREPDVSALPASLNPRITDLIRRSLEKNPKRRWYAVADIRWEIEAILADPRNMMLRTEPIAVKRPLWKRAFPVAFALMAGAAIAGITVWNVRPSAVPARVTRFTFTLPEDQRLTSPTRQLLSISPDGTQFVYVANGRLYLKSMSELESVSVQGTELGQGPQNPVFSPDGRSLAFWSSGTIKRIAVSGGVPVTICQAGFLFGMSWGPDDSIVFGQGPKGIMRVSANGDTRPERIGAVQGAELAHGPQILPGGKALLFTLATTRTGGTRWDQANIVVQSLDSGVRKIIKEGTDARYVPTGHLIYALRGTLLAVPFDVKRLEVTGRPVPIIVGVRLSSVPGAANTGTAQFDFSNSGSLIYIPGLPDATPQRQIALVDRNNGNIKPLQLAPGPYLSPRISPNGKELAVVTDDGSYGSEIITLIYELSGTTSMRRLTFGGNNDGEVWSGDGQWLILRSTREGDIALFRQRADGSGSPERLTKPEGGAGHAAGSGNWSGRSQVFPFTEYRGAEYDLWVYSMTDRKATPFDTASGSEQTNGVFSPNGRWLAYSSNENGRSEIFIKPYPKTSSKFQITSEGGAHPLWSPDGKELFYQNNGNLYSVAIQSQPKLTWSNAVSLPIKGFYQQDVRPRHYDITPDGKQFVMVFSVQALTKKLESPQIQVVLNWFEELKQRTGSR